MELSFVLKDWVIVTTDKNKIIKNIINGIIV